jgi:hypothetical protein
VRGNALKKTNDLNFDSSVSFGERLFAFYAGLRFEGELPPMVGVMNPYTNPATSRETLRCVREFTNKYYQGNVPRLGCFGINPGRFGGGLTGLSFTDPVILREVCGIANTLSSKHELSAEFVWRVIEAYGGAEAFFASNMLTAVSPLGFVKMKQSENSSQSRGESRSQSRGESQEVNYNFYDDSATMSAVKPFIVSTLRQQIALGLRTDVAICLGTGKLKAALDALNGEYRFFDRIVALEHPRFIMQYRRSEILAYVEKYLRTLRDCG